MKLFIRIIVILGVSLLAEVISALVPLPIPASVYGLVLMLLGLCTRIISFDQVQKPGMFLIDVMPVMFIPAAVGLIDRWSELKPLLVPVVVIMVVSTFVVMGVSGCVTQALIRSSRRRKGGAGK